MKALPLCAWSVLGILALPIQVIGQPQDPPTERADPFQKGSLLIFPAYEVQFGSNGVVVQDTIIELTNDFPDNVMVQMYLFNGDLPLPALFGERAHPGWNYVNNKIPLTGNQPFYWSAATGQPVGTSPLSILDPGPPAGRPNPDGGPNRVIRGYLLAFAVDPDGFEINWNHLSGRATVINYASGWAWEYTPYAFQAIDSEHGMQTDGNPGQMLLNGVEYDACPGTLLFDFYAPGAILFSGNGNLATVLDTDLTLMPVNPVDLRDPAQFGQSFGPIRALAEFAIWNQNEVKFSGTQRQIICWDQRQLSNYPIPNHFPRAFLQTNKGKARIDSIVDSRCENLTFPTPLLGVASRTLLFLGMNPDFGASGETLVGQGCEEGAIFFDVQGAIPPESPEGVPGVPPDLPSREGLSQPVKANRNLGQ